MANNFLKFKGVNVGASLIEENSENIIKNINELAKKNKCNIVIPIDCNTSLNSFSEVVETIDPDIIGLQESYETGLEIANRFNYCFYGNIENSTAVLSKYEIEFITNSQ